MYITVDSAFVLGVNGLGVKVEVDLASGLPQTILVGLPDSTIRESVERVRTAIKNAGHRFPLERITINLAPADLKKDGTGFDLAIAVAILIASKQLTNFQLEKTLIVGELALSGEVRGVRGLLAILEYAKQQHFTHIILPKENEAEAALISGLQIALISHLKDLPRISYLPSHCLSTIASHTNDIRFTDDITDINGQYGAKRALLIAAAGKHNIAVMGPPGVGKTMLMRRLPTILPRLTEQEALEVTKINSLSANLKTSSLITIPPFRQPHHTISAAGLIGGGSPAKPGEISLSHLGVLFLDEFTEYPRYIIELLRQPLEQRSITISRARAVYQFPAHFILAVSFNPCPCGLFGYDNEEAQCKCTTFAIQKYRTKLSGPLLDRIDLQLTMARPSLASLPPTPFQLQSSKDLQQLVIQTRDIQLKRNQQYGYHYNSDLSGKGLAKMSKLSPDAEALLQLAYDQLKMSYRGYDKIIKLARTIADLTESEDIKREHISEAITYRSGDLALT